MDQGKEERRKGKKKGGGRSRQIGLRGKKERERERERRNSSILTLSRNQFPLPNSSPRGGLWRRSPLGGSNANKISSSLTPKTSFLVAKTINQYSFRLHLLFTQYTYPLQQQQEEEGENPPFLSFSRHNEQKAL